ncbi:FAD-dependent oxidoreductase [Pedobacter sp. MC2016-24]|uniref:FAD-dependent oxidoreductase n=1 Tax=Pedobacter sp. MC2016-24 TaxID=2780090 RepID=UPI00187FE6C6|nr:FAD-dependent oxidoreductase [Pedobacter sp. MC2016-24]MBE9602235.1 FAD-dependent oxidoreductase [Pedobacter sp. MC2016-24]
MKYLFKVILLLLVATGLHIGQSYGQQQPAHSSYDICIYGGTSAGVIAAYTAAKLGKEVLLIEPGKTLGGMSSGGLGLTDIGNKYAISGLALDFYRRIGQHYGKFEQWVFEPHVAENIFQDYVRRAKVEVLYENRLIDVKKQGKLIRELVLEHSTGAGSNVRVSAKMFIDCSYEGDLMAKAGVSYAVGREANSDYKETFNGVQLMNGHQLPDGIDPYRTPGDPGSGLLWGISNGQLAANGTGDRKLQAYNFRICLSSDPNNQVPITQPTNYQPERYELLLRQMAKRDWKSLQDVFIWSGMPNGKTDINNRNGFSTDMIGMNWEYPEADYTKRAEIWNAHTDYTKGLLYFVGNDKRVPDHIRAEMKKWGYPKDEYVGNNHWSHQLYIREARRMVGALVMTQHHCQGKERVTDGVGTAAYTMDSHNCDRLIVNGQVKNEGNVEEGGFGPYPISYRAIIPKASEVENLSVPVCLSATHIAYGSIRMEPVFMVLAQSAATAAVQAIEKRQSMQRIDVKQLQATLKGNPLVNGSKPEILLDNSDLQAVQKNGTWRVETYGGYGPDFYVASPAAGLSSLKYQPSLTLSGKYDLYTYYPKQKDRASATRVDIHDGKQLYELSIKDAEVTVLGQTSGEWVHLGRYTFTAGKQSYVEISNQGANADVIADAVLLVPIEGFKE